MYSGDTVYIQELNRWYQVQIDEIYQKALIQSTENFRIIKNKYDNTLATATDLLEAEVIQLQSRLMVVGATVDAIVAYNKLLQTAGILTP